MRKALSKEKLKGIYGRIAKRYDLQHSLITFSADQKGRRILIENTVKEGDAVLDCGSGTGTTFFYSIFDQDSSAFLIGRVAK